MAINRYTQLTYNDPNDLPLLSLPYEALDQVLGQYQGQKDQFDQISQLGFNYLQESPTDIELAGQVNQYQAQIRDQLTEVAATGDVDRYMDSLRQSVRSLVDMRTPGGPIYALESRYKQFQQSREELKEQFKKDTVKMNYEYALANLNPGDIGYDMDDGTFNNITTPTVQNYVDIKDRILETAKAMHPEITGISQVRGDYVWDIEGKRYYVGDAFKGILTSPEIQEQLNIEAWYKTRNLSDEQRQEVIRAAESSADVHVSELEGEMRRLEALSQTGKRKDAIELQATLKQLGYKTGPIDGVVGPNTKNALNSALHDMQSEMQAVQLEYDESDVPGLVKQTLIEGYGTYMGSLLPSSRTEMIKTANWRAKLRASKQAQYDLLSQFAVNTQQDLFPVYEPASAVQLAEMEKEATGNLKESRQAAENILADLQRRGSIESGLTIDDIPARLIELSKLEAEHQDREQLIAAYANRFGLDEVAAEKEVTTLQTDDRTGGGPGLIPTIQQYAETKRIADAVQNQNMSVRSTYAKKPQAETVIQDAWQTAQEYLNDNNIESNIGYEEFKKKFLQANDARELRELPPNQYQKYKRRFNKGLEKDMDENRNDYKSATQYSLSGSDLLDDVSEQLVKEEKAGSFQYAIDENDMPAEYQVNGETKDPSQLDMSSNPEMDIVSTPHGPMLVFKRKTTKGEIARKVVKPADVAQRRWVREKMYAVMARALNEQNMADAMLILPFIKPVDALSSYTANGVNPEQSGQTGFVNYPDDQGRYNQELYKFVPFTEVYKDDATGLSVVAVRTPNKAVEYFPAQVNGSSINIMPDINGNFVQGSDSADNAIRLVNLAAIERSPEMMRYRREYSQRPLKDISPDVLPSVISITQDLYE